MRLVSASSSAICRRKMRILYASSIEGTTTRLMERTRSLLLILYVHMGAMCCMIANLIFRFTGRQPSYASLAASQVLNL
jgi:hypothetical protein